MKKRTALKLVLAGAAAAMLAGCGDKTEAPKEAAAPEKTAAAPADKAAGPYKVAFVYVSPASEEGWSRQHDLARLDGAIELAHALTQRIAAPDVTIGQARLAEFG